MDGTVLIADDDRTIRTVLTQALTRAGCKVHATSSLSTLMRWVSEGWGDVVVSDVVMPDGNGLEMLPKISQERPDLPVIVISAQNTIMTAIQASEAKAYDYLPKPFDLPDLLKRVAQALEKNAKKRAPQVEDNLQNADALPLVGRTKSMQELYRMVSQLRNASIPLMIWGENGTGKSLIARIFHDYSNRHNGPCISVDSSEIEDRTTAQQLLTRAKGGTLIFEDVTGLSLNQQAQIVWMMDQTVSDGPRFIGTTQKDLTQNLDDLGLREDLFFRLGGAVVHVPPLRERMDDIPLLFRYFFEECSGEDAEPQRLSDAALELVISYTWPGNIRQLEHMVKRLVLTTNSPTIPLQDIQSILGQRQTMTRNATSGFEDEKLGDSVARHIQRYFDLHKGMLPPAGLYHRILREIELPLLEIALESTAGNQAKCAELLGINRNTLRKKINELDMEVTRRRKLM